MHSITPITDKDSIAIFIFQISLPFLIDNFCTLPFYPFNLYVSLTEGSLSQFHFDITGISLQKSAMKSVTFGIFRQEKKKRKSIFAILTNCSFSFLLFPSMIPSMGKPDMQTVPISSRHVEPHTDYGS